MLTAQRTSSDMLAGVPDVSVQEAWAALKDQPHSMLIDVRTEPEWAFSGRPDLSSLGKDTVLLSWRLYPDFELNMTFVNHLGGLIGDKETPLYFLCKTGGRSRDAAEVMLAEGYTQCFNIAHGFEGDPNDQAQRGSINGWKAEGLPWQQV